MYFQGGLIGIDMYFMPCDLQESLRRFEELAGKTFPQDQGRLSLTRKFQRLISALVRDYQYDLSAIESAFQQSLGISPKIFNPLKNDTKVAVTTTTARLTIPCLMSNYNGGQRSRECGM